MGKYISFGKYNKLYKYILIYVIIRIVDDYLFSDAFPETMKLSIFEYVNYPHNILIQPFFNYCGAFISSIFFYYYLKSKIQSQDNTYESQNGINLFQNYELIHYIYQPNIKIKIIIITTLLSIISIESINALINAGFWSLLFWVFDLFFIAYINLIMFEIPIYSHKKFALFFIIFFCSFFKFLSTYEYISNDNINLFYKNHIILIPIIIIIYLCLSLLRFYSICKIKWILDFKFIPIRIFFGIYNFFGIIILLIACLISSYAKCTDKSKINDIDLLCFVKMEKGDKIEYYFDSFSYFFEQLWRKDRKAGMNILYLFLFIIQIFLNALRILYSLIIISRLNPEYYLCSFEIYFFFIRLIRMIKAIVEDDNIKASIYNLVAEMGSLFGITIYLELIELKFCNLNNNLKKNIESSSIIEYNLNNIYNENDEFYNDSSSSSNK